MISILKSTYRKVKYIHQRILFYYSINWIKTLYFNYRKFPYNIAKKLPVYFYGRVRFSSLTGRIIIDAPLKAGMIGFGQRYEFISQSKGTAEIYLDGTMVVKGHVQFGKDYFIYIGKDAYCEFGHLASLGRDGKIICKNNIKLGNYARLGYESQISDTNYHQMIDKNSGEKFPMTSPIQLGNYNYIGNRVSIMPKTKTPDYCTIASNSLCNKDYTELGENILMAGIPTRLIRGNISRDWEGEQEQLNRNLIV